MEESEKVYTFRRIKGRPFVFVNRKLLPILPSEKIICYATEGFDWGTPGPGTAQLAIAILLDFTQNRSIAINLHQHFKLEFLAADNRKNFQIHAGEIDKFLKENRDG